MNSGLIAALIVMVVMVVFTLVILKMIAASTGNKIRDNVISQLQTYEQLIQTKVTELNEIKKQIESEQEKLLKEDKVNEHGETALPELYVPAGVEYRDQELAEDYRYIKEQFSFDRRKIVNEIYRLCKEKRKEDNELLWMGLVEKFTFENVYKLSALEVEEQLEVIADILSEDEMAVLNEYTGRNKEFDCIRFYQWIYIQKQIHDKQIYVRSAEKNEDYHDIGESIEAVYDQNLCEGFQVLTGNQLYDYGIRKQELL